MMENPPRARAIPNKSSCGFDRGDAEVAENRRGRSSTNSAYLCDLCGSAVETITIRNTVFLFRIGTSYNIEHSLISFDQYAGIFQSKVDARIVSLVFAALTTPPLADSMWIKHDVDIRHLRYEG